MVSLNNSDVHSVGLGKLEVTQTRRRTINEQSANCIPIVFIVYICGFI